MTGRVVALLPMKANSVRVKSKNFRSFAGRPLYQWILETLLQLDEIDEVVINTDAQAELAAHGFDAIEHGGRVTIRSRPKAIRGDLVSMNRVIADDLAHVPADIYLMTHTTNPLLSPETVSRAFDAFRAASAAGRADSLFTVNRVQTRFYRADGSAVNHDPENLIRTQDLEPWFEENSNLYLFTATSFAATGARIGQRPMLFETPKLEALDIDGPDDWALAEAVALRRVP
ncbi:MAG: acylneuraminate cytidylyltransferase family protein [Pseudomonadota bacterium]